MKVRVTKEQFYNCFNKYPQDKLKFTDVMVVLAGKVGLEPTAYRLTADCSAIELLPK